MKKLFVFILLAVSVMTAQAQRFEWAKGYTVASNSDRSIVGGVTDSLGNLYILGNCDATSVWDGTEDIIPTINKSTKDLLNDVLIAKISPEGEMVWKKVIFGNNSNSCIPHDIKKIGDTAFACLVELGLPEGITNYCYYLDTFMVGYSDYPIPLSAETASNTHFTALITFNFSGEVIEQHFLQISYIDSAGNDYRIGSNQPIMKEFFWQPAFDVDNFGNIYISRITHGDDITGLVSVQDGSAIGLKFWVDQRYVGTVYVNDGYHPGWMPQILKFSPHFDTLLACRYVVEKSAMDYFSNYNTYLKCDVLGNVYFSTRHSMNGSACSNVIIIDSVENIMLRHSEKSSRDVTYYVKFDSTLAPKWVIWLDDSILDERQVQMGKYFHDIDFDYDSNLLFLSASVGRSSYLDTVTDYSLFTYRGTPIPIRNDACVLSFYNSDSVPLMHSCAVIPSSVSSVSVSIYSKNTLSCKNNRIFFQSQYTGNLTLPTQNIMFTDRYNEGFAMVMFDYSGRVIGGFDYGIETRVNNYAGPIVLHDSVLYLCNLLKTSAQFGNISFPVSGETNVIAKYVDTAFMHPYVRPSHGINTVTAVTPRVYPVPATDRLHFDCPAGGVPTAVAAISLSGWRMPLTATTTTADISCLAPGAYLLEITTAKEKYYTKFIKH